MLMHKLPHVITLNQENQLMKIFILYGTETGNSELFAEDVQAALKDQHEVTLVDMQNATLDMLSPENDLTIIIISTYGEGEYPTNAQAFVKIIQDKQPDLHGCRIAFFGLGDTFYTGHYNVCVKTLQKLLTGLGAEQIGPCGLHDASSGQMIDELMQPWLDAIFSDLKKQ